MSSRSEKQNHTLSFTRDSRIQWVCIQFCISCTHSACHCHKIYGEEEKIYGYNDLVIDVSDTRYAPAMCIDASFQLKFASGSLAQYLSIRHSAKLGSSSTVDDVEGTLSGFIPEGESDGYSPFSSCPNLCATGYYTDEASFLARVAEDATSFKPTGQLIHTYTRPSPFDSDKGKGKGPAQQHSLDSESEDAVVFEVYHVSPFLP